MTEPDEFIRYIWSKDHNSSHMPQGSYYIDLVYKNYTYRFAYGDYAIKMITESGVKHWMPEMLKKAHYKCDQEMAIDNGKDREIEALKRLIDAQDAMLSNSTTSSWRRHQLIKKSG